MSKHKHGDEIEELIEAFQKSGARELHLRYGDIEVHLGENDQSQGAAAPPFAARKKGPAAPARSQQPATAPAAPQELPAGCCIVRAPYLGTFYRSAKPGSAPYVEVGATTEMDTEVCLIEVMKLFTAVRAGIAGRVHSVLVNDGQLVEANQPLLVIEPA